MEVVSGLQAAQSSKVHAGQAIVSNSIPAYTSLNTAASGRTWTWTAVGFAAYHRQLAGSQASEMMLILQLYPDTFADIVVSTDLWRASFRTNWLTDLSLLEHLQSCPGTQSCIGAIPILHLAAGAQGCMNAGLRTLVVRDNQVAQVGQVQHCSWSLTARPFCIA